MSSIRKSVSIEFEIWKRAQERRRGLGYKKMSPYLQFLIERDLEARGPHVLQETPAAAPISSSPGATSISYRTKRRIVGSLKKKGSIGDVPPDPDSRQ